MESTSFAFAGESYVGAPDFSAETFRKLDQLSANGQLQDYGDLLFSTTFRGPTLEGFERIRAVLNDPNKMFSLRLAIAPDAPALHELWWECLRDVGGPPHSRVIARSTYMSFSRCLPSHANGGPMNIDGRLRVLAVISNPNDLGQGNSNWGRFAPLDYRLERDLFKNALGQGKIQDSIEFELLDESIIAGRNEIKARLRDDFNVLHLVGHAGYENGKEELFFLLQGENGGACKMHSSELIEMLGGLRQLRLVFLHPAHTVTISQNQADAWVQLAVDILGAVEDLPAVIAMKNPLDIQAGQKFIGRFYDRLFYSKNNPGKVDAATNDARADVVGDESKRAAPVLYLRGSSHLFHFEPAKKKGGYAKESSRGSFSYTEGQRINTQPPGQLRPLTQPVPLTDRNSLYHKLIDQFNEDELVELCFFLGIKQGELKKGTIREFAINLIEHCERHGLYERLVEEVRRLRPDRTQLTGEFVAFEPAAVDVHDRAMIDKGQRRTQLSDVQKNAGWSQVN